MSKMIPLSDKQMKSMGIVKSKNGFLMRPLKPSSPSKPSVPSNPNKESNHKPERYVSDKAPKIHSEPVRQSTNNNSSVSRVERKQESQRLSDRGIY